MTTTRPRPALLSVEGLDELLGVLRAREYEVMGPVARDGVIGLEEITTTADLPAGHHDTQAPGSYRLEYDEGDPELFGWAVGPESLRRHLSPPVETVATIDHRDGRFEVTVPETHPAPRAFVGLRPCDVAAAAIHARVRPGDDVVRVVVQCTHPADTCFCSSMGTGPAAVEGFDLALTELVEGDHVFVVEVGSELGASLLDEVTHRPATDEESAAAADAVEAGTTRISRHVDHDRARSLATRLDHPHWQSVAQRCLSCANCTLVCPTCFCSAVIERVDLEGGRTTRVQEWASCFELEHSYLHGVGPVRADASARYRQWLTHKLSTWWDQFGTSGCVGCGRCITWCPVGIDLTAEVVYLTETEEAT